MLGVNAIIFFAIKIRLLYYVLDLYTQNIIVNLVVTGV